MAARTAAAAQKRPVGRPRKLPLAVREELVLDAAAAAFAERGTTEVSIEAIAAKVGINKALVYEHFRSKDDLVAAVVVRERDRLVAFIGVRHAESVGDPLRDRVRARFHAFLDFAAAHPASLRVLALPQAATILSDAGRGAAVPDVARFLRDDLERAGLPTGELPALLAAMFVGMANEVIHRSASSSWDPETVVDLLTDFTLAGLAGVDRELLDRASQPATET